MKTTRVYDLHVSHTVTDSGVNYYALLIGKEIVTTLYAGDEEMPLALATIRLLRQAPVE